MGDNLGDFVFGLAIGAGLNLALLVFGGSFLSNMIEGNKSFCSKYSGAKNKLCLGKCIYWKGKPEFNECMATGGVKG